MNLQLQPRTDPMLSHAYPACALSDSSHSSWALPVYGITTPNRIWLNELALRPLPHDASPTIPPLPKQLNHIQRP